MSRINDCMKLRLISTKKHALLPPRVVRTAYLWLSCHLNLYCEIDKKLSVCEKLAFRLPGKNLNYDAPCQEGKHNRVPHRHTTKSW